MADELTIATCVIDYCEDKPEPGYYFSLTDGNGNKEEPIGPYGSQESAEVAFMTAMEEATVEMVKKTLGLED